jgi:hypothetical protein
MATNSLTGAAPSAFYPQLIHIGAGTLSGGATLRLGDGTATPLSLSTAGAAVAGTLAASGPALLTGVQNLTGAGAVNTTDPVTVFTSTAGTNALTLADGTHGQIKTIVMANAAGTGVLTPATKTGYTTITFGAAGVSVTLQFLTGAGWIVLGYYYTTFA